LSLPLNITLCSATSIHNFPPRVAVAFPASFSDVSPCRLCKQQKGNAGPENAGESKLQLQLILIAGRHFCAMQSIGKVLLN